MKRVCLLLISALLLGGLVSCRTRDNRTVMIRVPAMKNAACSEVVVKAVAACQGVFADKTRVDLPRRLIFVQYDSLQTALKNVEFAVAEAGFQANEVPAKPEAVKALPPECQ